MHPCWRPERGRARGHLHIHPQKDQRGTRKRWGTAHRSTPTRINHPSVLQLEWACCLKTATHIRPSEPESRAVQIILQLSPWVSLKCFDSGGGSLFDGGGARVRSDEPQTHSRVIKVKCFSFICHGQHYLAITSARTHPVSLFNALSKHVGPNSSHL